MFLVGIVPNCLTVFLFIPEARLSLSGKNAQGKITHKAVRKRGRGRRNHEIDYEFALANKTYTGTARLSKQVWSQKKVGEALTIVYLPANPKRNRTKEWKLSNFLAGPCLIGMFGMVFVSLENEMITNERAGLSVAGDATGAGAGAGAGRDSATKAGLGAGLAGSAT